MFMSNVETLNIPDKAWISINCLTQNQMIVDND